MCFYQTFSPHPLYVRQLFTGSQRLGFKSLVPLVASIIPNFLEMTPPLCMGPIEVLFSNPFTTHVPSLTFFHGPLRISGGGS